jgi:hypothetical protein
MRAFALANPGRHGVEDDGTAYYVEPRRAVALDLSTGQTFSASDGDYFTLADDEPLTGEDGAPMVLAVPTHGFLDALTGQTL